MSPTISEIVHCITTVTLKLHFVCYGRRVKRHAIYYVVSAVLERLLGRSKFDSLVVSDLKTYTNSK